MILNFSNFYYSAHDIKDLNIIEEKDSKKDAADKILEYGRRPPQVEPSRLLQGSPTVSTVAVKRKPRNSAAHTSVAESLAKVK